MPCLITTSIASLYRCTDPIRFHRRHDPTSPIILPRPAVSYHSASLSALQIAAQQWRLEHAEWSAERAALDAAAAADRAAHTELCAALSAANVEARDRETRAAREAADAHAPKLAAYQARAHDGAQIWEAKSWKLPEQ
jgi:hypothetical protein